jgi:hypothetical protein
MTNLVFSRRAVQAALYGLANHLTPAQIGKLVNALNRPGEARMVAMWEAILLNALGQLTSFRHEEELANRRRPDFAFSLDHESSAFQVMGDVTAPSDRGLQDHNPLSLVESAIKKAAKDAGLRGGLRIQVRGGLVGALGKRRMRLALPTRSTIPRFIATYVAPFFASVQQRPATGHARLFKADDVDLDVSYDPAGDYFSMGHPSFDVPYSLTENPVARALRLKGDQLAAAPSDAVRLVVLADGGCNLLKLGRRNPGGHFGALEVVDDFLRQTSKVDAVLLLAITEKHISFPSSSQINLHAILRIRRGNERRPALAALRAEALYDFCSALVANLPAPQRTPLNAIHREQMTLFPAHMHNGYRMTDASIKVSSRLVLEILAGKVSLDAVDSEWRELFSRKLSSGQMIEACSLVSGGDNDDDEVEFRFGQPDAAIGPFRSNR